MKESSKNYYEVNHLQASAISIKTKQLTQCRPHVCDVCDKGFRWKSELTRHSYIHTGEKPFHCSYCTSRFSDPTGLRLHEKRHRGEKDLKCPYCPKAFVLSHHLNNHIRVHNGQKPYSCRTCLEEGEKSEFATSHQLTHHIRRNHTHDFPYKCKNCRKEYAMVGHLNQHLKSAHGVLLPYECSKCDQRFRLQTELLCHEGIHEDNEEQIKQLPKNVLAASTLKSTNELVQSQNTTTGEKSQKVPFQIQDIDKQNSCHKKNETELTLVKKKSKLSKNSTNKQFSKVSDTSNEILILEPEKDEITIECEIKPNEKSLKTQGKLDKSSSYNPVSEISNTSNEIFILESEEEEEISILHEIKSQNKLEQSSSNTFVSQISEESNEILILEPEEDEIIIEYDANQNEKPANKSYSFDSKKEKKKKRKILDDVNQENQTEKKKIKSSNQVNVSETEDYSQNTKHKTKKQKVIHTIDSQSETAENESENVELVENIENDDFEIYECSCGKYFSSSLKFKRHRKRRGHRRPRIHICPYCVDESFKTMRAFEKHFNEFHCDNEEEEDCDSEEEEYVYELDEDHLMIHECSLCYPKIRAFLTIDDLERHFNKIHV